MLRYTTIDDKFMDLFEPEIQAAMKENPGLLILFVVIAVVVAVILCAAYLFVCWGLIKLNHKIFTRMEKKKGSSLKYQFLEKLVRIIIIIVVIVIPFAGEKFGQSILGSTAVMAAIIGFAGQDVLKDILSGFLISVYKPFDIGDRIELEDGTVGVVESITMRHVVIIRIDTLRQVIPNSKLNTMSIINYSYDYVDRSMVFKFPVGYDSDIEKTKKVIHDAIDGSEYSRPDKKYKDGTVDYAPVYFIDIGNSALIMSATVYFNRRIPSEIVKDDINCRVFEALKANGIEVPYDYMTIVMKGRDQIEGDSK